MSTDPMTTDSVPTPQESALAQSQAHRRRATLILMVVAAAFVIVPFLFWQQTWFGRPLTEEELGKFLTDQEKPRNRQHALVQIGERIARGDASVRRWYPEVVRLAKSPLAELRVTSAWVMGADTRSEEFHGALLELLQDTEPLVRRNAALSLVRFSDPSGHQQLLGMLRPYILLSPAAGVLRYRLQEGKDFDSGVVVARLETGGEQWLDIHSPVPGTLERMAAPDGSPVSAGQKIALLSPAPEHVWESLRALFRVGRPDDLPEVERFARGQMEGMPEKIQQQAVLTAQEIRRRAAQQ